MSLARSTAAADPAKGNRSVITLLRANNSGGGSRDLRGGSQHSAREPGRAAEAAAGAAGCSSSSSGAREPGRAAEAAARAAEGAGRTTASAGAEQGRAVAAAAGEPEGAVAVAARPPVVSVWHALPCSSMSKAEAMRQLQLIMQVGLRGGWGGGGHAPATAHHAGGAAGWVGGGRPCASYSSSCR